MYPFSFRLSTDPNLENKLKTIFDAVKDHRNLKDRQLANIFLKLPSKTVCYLFYFKLRAPNVYAFIEISRLLQSHKKPTDLENIGQKVKASLYGNMKELLADIVFMFDNARR